MRVASAGAALAAHAGGRVRGGDGVLRAHGGAAILPGRSDLADDDRALDASKVGAVEDSNGYDFVVNTFADARASAATCAR